MDKISLTIEKGKSGLFYITSADIKGLLIAERTLTEALAAVPKGIGDLVLAVIEDRIPRSR